MKNHAILEHMLDEGVVNSDEFHILQAVEALFDHLDEELARYQSGGTVDENAFRRIMAIRERIYENACAQALMDGVITPEEESILEIIKRRIALTDDEVDHINEVMQQASLP